MARTARTARLFNRWVVAGVALATALMLVGTAVAAASPPQRVKDISPGGSGSYPRELTRIGSTLYFYASDDINGYELWQSDGTAAGTTLERILAPTARSLSGDHPGRGDATPLLARLIGRPRDPTCRRRRVPVGGEMPLRRRSAMLEIDLTPVRQGWEVLGSDGEKLGTVKDPTGDHLVIEKGLIFKHDLYVPRSYIGGVGEECVTLTVPKDEVDSMGWNEPGGTAEPGGSGSWSGGASEPDMDDSATERPTNAGLDREKSESAGTGATAGSTSDAAQRTETDDNERLSRPADLGAYDPGAPQSTGGDITTMTGVGYGAGAGASSGGSLGAVSGPDAQTDRAGGSGRAGTSDLAPPTDDQVREGRP